MMRADTGEVITSDGGIVIPETATVLIDGHRVSARHFLRSIADGSFAGGNIVREPDGELAIESFAKE